MTISVGVLSFIIGSALVVSIAAPLVLLIMWIIELKKGQLW
jgi:hypothetical protein